MTDPRDELIEQMAEALLLVSPSAWAFTMYHGHLEKVLADYEAWKAKQGEADDCPRTD